MSHERRQHSRKQSAIVTTATSDTLIADPSGDQVCSDVQWLLYVTYLWIPYFGIAPFIVSTGL
ncbi:hypothetical protein B2G88_16620 [Natronolimnobius baerhuensis]|uniref:Uncharacterized protein n=1 Tax=Natronolimnobius baerhuensis TaxID=253108 RepID=A0A202E426_9EURY|nr:hypothetical protein B2G88_16620 [Natronolimnobius baerhuensis]